MSEKLTQGNNESSPKTTEWDSLTDLDNQPMMPDTFRRKVDAYKKECASFMDPIIERFNAADINEIGEAFDYDDEASCCAAVRVLSDLLDIEQPRVVFKTIERNGDPYLYFGIHKNGNGLICIPHSSNNDILLINAVDVISHEMWHAYQHDVIRRNGERADIYRKDFDNYIPAERDIEGYISQPVELEAYIFSEKNIR